VPVNSLDFPRYEFFYPWEYAYQRQTQFIANHRSIIQFKRDANASFVTGLAANAQDNMRIRQTLAAEFRYLAGFQEFLEGMPLSKQYQVFDDALSVAPWNDSLRARIYLQYVYNARSSRLPAERARLRQKAEALYEQP